MQVLPEMHYGGVETGVADLTRKLAAMGHKNVVVSNGGRLIGELALGVKHYRLPVHSKNPFVALSLIGTLRKIIRSESIDIVHARSRVPAIIAFFAVKTTDARFVTTCHGYYARHIFSKVMGWGRTVIVLSNSIGNHMIRDFNVDPSRIRIVHRGVDLERFKYRPKVPKRSKEIKIGMVGRLSPLKGQDDFLRAVSRVVRVLPSSKALIIGGASCGKEEYRRRLDLLARRLGITKYVQFLGARADIPDILKELDLLVLSTVEEEGFGRVIIEAGACGVPVVATDVGGVKDIITHRKNGILVEPRQPIKLAEAIIEVLRDRRLSESLSRNGRRIVEDKFALDAMVSKTLDVYKEAAEKENILIIKFGAIGDVILAVPSMREVRRRYPKAFIAVLAAGGSREVLQRCPYIDEVILFERHADRTKRLFGTFRRLAGYNFDISIDLQNNLDSHLLAFIAGIPKRIGYDNGKLSMLLNKKIKSPGVPISPVAHQYALLRLAGIEARDQRLELWPSERDKEKVNRLLKDNWVDETQPLIGMSPAASSRWLTKRWPIDKFAALSDMISRELRVRTVVTGSRADMGIVKDAFHFHNGRAVDACGRTTLMELASLIKRCSVFVAGDSASLHIAASVGTPFVALFGPTDPKRHLPPSKEFVVLQRKLKCAPCYKTTCKDIRCMRLIKVEDVFNAVKELLERQTVHH